ncbi:CapA family protein [Bosea sp. LjRoot9]|uniref:CapA family protein n=1 Tax=Bosea sp. LjRoot9 TaxID=3342341 RepID=UPI003ED15DB0
MTRAMYLLGDINLKGVDDPSLVFEHVAPKLAGASMVFANLECCLFDDAATAAEQRGFYVPTRFAAVLKAVGLHAVGMANNVNIGQEAITSSLAALGRAGIATVGAGLDAAAAREPLIIERDGLRYGILQRTAIYWPDTHEAGPGQVGVAVIKAHTAYRPKLEQQAARTRPGVPPEVVTWADPGSLAECARAIANLRERADIVIASFHWGYRAEILNYQREFAHAAIDAGADLVFGHGPHMILPIELHAGRPIVYGCGNFSFQFAHDRVLHAGWVGMFLRASIADGAIGSIEIAFVERNAANQTVVRAIDELPQARDRLTAASAELGCRLETDGGILRLSLGA